MASSVSLAMASMKPAPSMLVEMRNVLTLSSNGTSSKMSGWVDRDWISEPPTDSTNCSSLQAPGAVLGDLAGAARDDVLVTFAAGLRVVRRPEAVGDRLDFLEDEAVVVERTQRHHRVLVDGVEGRTLRVEAVGAIVEGGRRFGRAGPVPVAVIALLPHQTVMGKTLPAGVVSRCRTILLLSSLLLILLLCLLLCTSAGPDGDRQDHSDSSDAGVSRNKTS